MTTTSMRVEDSVDVVLRLQRERGKRFLGYLELNQGSPTISGRMTLDEFAEYTVVHNRKWADEAAASVDTVTQREIIDAHANGLATFILQGLVAATAKRLKQAASEMGDEASG